VTNVLIIAPESAWYAGYLGERFPEVRIDGVDGYADATAFAASVEVLMALAPGLTRELVAAMPGLQWLQAFTSGVDHLLPALADRPDVIVTNARGIHGRQMSEMALLHMLSLGRGTVQLVEAKQRGEWARREQQTLFGRTVGIVGLGSSGEQLALVCKAFGMEVVGISKTVRSVPGVDRVVTRGQLVDVAPELDYLILVVPEDDETRALVDVDVLAAMKPTAFLVNLARGPVVDQAALVEALERGSIAGAGLDVTDPEPLPPSSPLWAMPNAFITPHLGGHSDRYRELVVTVAEPNLRAWLAGEELTNVVLRP